MEHISSRQNALVKRLRALVHDRGTGDEALLDGAHLVEEAVAAGVELRLVALASDGADGPLGALASRAAVTGARVVTLPPALLASVSPVRQPSGIVAIARLTGRPLDAVLAAPPRMAVLLEGVQDPGNVGAILRAAEACGASAAIVAPGTADPFGWKALRGAMGSSFRLPIASAPSPLDAVRAARASGLRVFATVPRGGTPLPAADLTRPSLFVLGGEGQGVSSGVQHDADELLTIPMRSHVESLNVAIAAALVLYEASRQRTHVAV